MELLRRADTIGSTGVAVLVAVVTTLLAGPVPAATYIVDSRHTRSSDDNAGTAESPFNTLTKAIAVAKGGDLVLLASGEYPAVSITTRYPETMTVRAREGAKPVFFDGVEFNGAQRVRIEGVTFTWRKDAKPSRMKPFIRIDGSRHIEVADCSITDDADKTEWLGMAASINASEHVTMRDCDIHYVYFGVSVTASEHVLLQGLDVGPWSHEDGIRATECLGPVLIEGCHLTNAAVAGRKGGHVDAIQVVFWSDNLTIRNCHIHGVAQAIGAFHCVDPRASIPNRRRKDWRIEGNLIYDVYTPHTCTICETDGVAVVNNTFPQGAATLFECTEGVVKNNIFHSGHLRPECIETSDHNLWINAYGSSGRQQTYGPNDVVGVNPTFANAPKFFGRCDFWGKGKKEQFTDRKLTVGESINGKIAVGDQIELLICDGRPRDGVLRKVVRVEGREIEVDSPTDVSMKGKMVLVYNWGPKPTSTKPDYRLQPGSPAVDSADGSVDRGNDMDGHAAFDHPDTPNTGAGSVKYLDRGAFEYIPPRGTAARAPSPSTRQERTLTLFELARSAEN